MAAATKSEAEDKWAEIKKLPLEIDALSLLSEALNFDFAKKGMDEPFTDAELDEMSGLQGIRDRVTSVKKNPTVREFIEISGRGRVHNPDRRRAEGGRGPAGSLVCRAGLRWFRAFRHPCAGRL